MRVLITGGTGSLGNALMRRWKGSAERIVIFSRDEQKQAEMAKLHSGENIRYFLGDVRDKERLQQALVGIDTVIHAAALKRVDAVAYNPVEVLKTNVLGTQNVIEASVASGVRSVLVVSSDKSVEPTNVYGSSKNVAEHLAVSANVYAVPRGTKVSVVRYGNVAWSRGSVLWAWAARDPRQPVPVTDRRMTRFWLTLDQAVDLIELGCSLLKPGEVLIPQLKAASLVDVAYAMFGYAHPIEGTGLRPGGEKIHETLLGLNEIDRAVACFCGPHFVLQPHLPTWSATQPLVSNVSEAYASDTAPKMTREEIMGLLGSKPV